MTRSSLPRHRVGTRVQYRDPEGVVVTGRVLYIEAHWYGAKQPIITYRITHPHRDRGDCVVTEKEIKGAI